MDDAGSTTVAEPQSSKPAAGINWGSLCRPIRKAAASEDKNRVRTYAQLLLPCYEPRAKNGKHENHCRHQLGLFRKAMPTL